MVDEYIRRQDVLKGKKTGTFANGICLVAEPCVTVEYIEALEPADVVQVCRCRKCKYFWTYRCMDSMPIETCELAQTFYNPDIDFCSLAERREE